MIKSWKNLIPNIEEFCFVVDEWSISGDVVMKEKANAWFYSVIRADVNKITIGKYTNIQDGAIVHVTNTHATTIGDYVTIGHGAKLHGCTIHDNALIGIGAIILDGAEIGAGAFVAAGCVIPPNKKIPENVVVVGNPCKIIREVNEDEKAGVLERCMKYAEVYPEAYK